MLQHTKSDAVDKIVSQWERERPDLDSSPIHIFGRLHRLSIHYQAVADINFKNHGITSSSFDVLAALRRSGPPFELRSSELVSGFLLSPAGVSLRLDRLEEDGLVQRHRDKKDRRIVYARLTPAGLAKANSVIETHLQIIQNLLKGLKKEDQTLLAELFISLQESMLAGDHVSIDPPLNN